MFYSILQKNNPFTVPSIYKISQKTLNFRSPLWCDPLNIFKFKSMVRAIFGNFDYIWQRYLNGNVSLGVRGALRLSLVGVYYKQTFCWKLIFSCWTDLNIILHGDGSIARVDAELRQRYSKFK